MSDLHDQKQKLARAPQYIVNISIILFLLGYSSWTLAFKITTIFNEGLQFNAIVFAPLFLLLFYLYKKSLSKDGLKTTGPNEIQIDHTDHILLLAFLGSFLISFLLRSFLLYWICTIIILSILFFKVIRKRKQEKLAAYPNYENMANPNAIGLALLLLFAILFGLLANRYDVDDTYYLAVSARAAESPTTPYNFSNHPGFPIGPVKNNYPFREWGGYLELIGLVSWLTDTQPLVTSSLIFSPWGSLLIVAAYTLFFRKLFPKNWFAMLFLTTAILLIDGSAHYGAGNMAFVRITQGKCVLYHVLRPLIFTFGMNFGENPNKKDFLLLLLSNIIATGLTPSGIWLAPLFTGIGILAGVIVNNKTNISTALLGLTSTVYPLIAGITSFQKTTAEMGVYERTSATWFNGLFISFPSIESVYLWVFAFAIIFCILMAPNNRSRALWLVSLIVFFFFGTNPLIAPFLAEKIVTIFVYWRVLWLVLLVPSAAYLLLFPSILFRKFVTRREKTFWMNLIAIILVVLSLTAFSFGVPQTYIFDTTENHIWFGFPGIKATRDEYNIATQVYSKLNPGSNIIAPLTISWILPTFKDPGWPVVLRNQEFNELSLTTEIPEEEILLRSYLDHYLSGEDQFDQKLIRDALDYFSVDAFIIDHRATNVNALQSLLIDEGFLQFEEVIHADFKVWIKGK